MINRPGAPLPYLPGGNIFTTPQTNDTGELGEKWGVSCKGRRRGFKTSLDDYFRIKSRV